MSEIWGIPSPTNRGPETTFFERLHNLMASLTAYAFGTRHDMDNWTSALATPTSSQNVMNFGPQTA